MEAIGKFFGALIGLAAGAAMISWLVIPTMAILVAMTIGTALQRFWLLIVVVVFCAAVLALLVRYIRWSESEQVTLVVGVTALAVVIILAIVWQWGGFLACSLAATVAAMLYGAGAVMCKSDGMRRTGLVASIQVLWLAPLTMIPYTYSYVGSGHAVAPIVAFLVGIFAAVWVVEGY